MNDLKNDKTIIVIASCTSCGVQQTVVFGKSRKPKCCKCKSGELAIIEYTKPAGFVRIIPNGNVGSENLL